MLWSRGELVKDGRARAIVLPYYCKSWRCPGPCRRYKAAQTFARVKAAMDDHEPEEVAYMVLTVDRKRYRSDEHAYVSMYRAWTLLRKRLVRMLGPFAYIVTIERHRDGWPHVNVMLVGDGWRACQGDGWKKLRQEIAPHAIECGFGLRFYLAPARSREALSGYFVKMARNLDDNPDDELDSTIAETVKASQLPLNAPPHFRRLRSSWRFLPPVNECELDWTGVLHNTDSGVIYNMPEGYDIDEKAGEIRRTEPKRKRDPEPSPCWIVVGHEGGHTRETLWIEDAETVERSRAATLDWKRKNGVHYARTPHGIVWVGAGNRGWFAHCRERTTGPWESSERAKFSAGLLYGRAWLSELAESSKACA